MLFAHLKRILKLDRLRLRGPNGAHDEFLLATTAQNLRKMAKLIPIPNPKPAQKSAQRALQTFKGQTQHFPLPDFFNRIGQEPTRAGTQRWFRWTDLDLVRRPDYQADGRALAGVAAVETGYAGPDLRRRALGALQSRSLLEAGASLLTAFAHLLGVLVQTLPHVFAAGVIALGGVWLVNHLDNSSLRMPSWMQASEQSGSPPGHQGSPPQDK